MITKKLYLESIEAAYLEEFTAEVIDIDDNKIVLDQTLFYPLGGGQNWDLGTLNGPNGKMNVVEVRGRDTIQHSIEDTFELEIGDEVTGRIDFERRYAHMKMHTAQHLVSGIAYEMFNGVRTVGNQIHTEKSRIDFKPIQFSEDMLLELQSTVNEKIQLGLEVTDSQMTRDEINSIMPQERTNMDLLPSFINDLRVVTIGDRQDLCPCAGTHVRNISEIKGIEFIGKKSKGKGTQRVTYKLND
ncbi:MAG: alanyl-tRNA editing protein [Candidatus Thermoplasmatota archaeon]|nr:alanyl-tRNA editing protein [Candidatus Thermoplasmatota archaeon]MEC8609981.1 alanyl-tRNA editing protein [Candidatus Thermoplasmatota archaeon]